MNAQAQLKEDFPLSQEELIIQEISNFTEQALRAATPAQRKDAEKALRTFHDFMYVRGYLPEPGFAENVGRTELPVRREDFLIAVGSDARQVSLFNILNQSVEQRVQSGVFVLNPLVPDAITRWAMDIRLVNRLAPEQVYTARAHKARVVQPAPIAQPEPEAQTYDDGGIIDVSKLVASLKTEPAAQRQSQPMDLSFLSLEEDLDYRNFVAAAPLADEKTDTVEPVTEVIIPEATPDTTLEIVADAFVQAPQQDTTAEAEIIETAQPAALETIAETFVKMPDTTALEAVDNAVEAQPSTEELLASVSSAVEALRRLADEEDKSRALLEEITTAGPVLALESVALAPQEGAPVTEDDIDIQLVDAVAEALAEFQPVQNTAIDDLPEDALEAPVGTAAALLPEGFQPTPLDDIPEDATEVPEYRTYRRPAAAVPLIPASTADIPEDMTDLPTDRRDATLDNELAELEKILGEALKDVKHVRGPIANDDVATVEAAPAEHTPIAMTALGMPAPVDLDQPQSTWSHLPPEDSIGPILNRLYRIEDAQPSASAAFTPVAEAQLEKQHPRWNPEPDFSLLKPSTWKSIKRATVVSFVTTAAITGVSRAALVTGATALGAAALPAGIAAGIVVGAAKTYADNHKEIMRQVRKGETAWEKTKIWGEGFRRSFTLPQIALTVGGSVLGAVAGEYVADRAVEYFSIVKEKVQSFVESLNTPVQSVEPRIYGPADLQLDTAPVQGDVTPRTPLVIPEVELEPPFLTLDGVPPALTLPQTGGQQVSADQVIASMHNKFDEAFAVLRRETDSLMQSYNNALEAGKATQAFPASAAGTAVASAAETAATATKAHIIAPGSNTLWKIAEQTYGTSGSDTARAVEKIIAANPELVANPGRLTLGQQIQLPTSLDGAKAAACNWNIRPGARLRCTLE